MVRVGKHHGSSSGGGGGPAGGTRHARAFIVLWTVDFLDFGSFFAFFWVRAHTF